MRVNELIRYVAVNKFKSLDAFKLKADFTGMTYIPTGIPGLNVDFSNGYTLDTYIVKCWNGYVAVTGLSECLDKTKSPSDFNITCTAYEVEVESISVNFKVKETV